MKKAKSLMIIATLIIIAAILVACNPNEQRPSEKPPTGGDVYTVTFNTDGGSAISAFTGTVIEIEPVPQKSGHKFLGWYANSLFSGSRITFPYTITKDVTLYAKWEKIENQFVCTFDSDGGSKIDDFVGTVINEEPLPQKADHDFAGWYRDESCSGDRVKFPLTLKEDITLYAKWTKQDDWVQTTLNDFVCESDEDGGTIIKSYKGNAEKIVLPQDVKYSLDDGFLEVGLIKGLKLPATVESIRGFSLACASYLEEIAVTDDHPTLKVVDNTLYTIDLQTMISHPMEDKAEKVTISPNTTEIGDYAFWGNCHLRSVEIPSSVESFGSSVFYGCSALDNLTIPKNASVSWGGLFNDKCTALTNLTCPPTLKKLEVLPNLKTLNIIGKGKEIYYAVCEGSASLQTLDMSKSEVEVISAGMFESNTALTTVILPSTLRNIRKEAFKGCTSLTTFELNDGLETLESNALSGTAIETLKLPDSLKKCQYFDNMRSLKTLYASASWFGSGQYSGMSAGEWGTIQNFIITSGDTLKSPTNKIGSLHTLVIPKSVKTIAEGALNNYYGLVQITNLSECQISPEISSDMLIPSICEVRTSEDTPFKGTITYEDNGFVSYKINNEKYLIDADENITQVMANQLDGYTAIYHCAFLHSVNLSSVSVPSCVKSIGYKAFAQCKSLSVVELTGGLTTLDRWCFMATGISEIKIPSTVTKVAREIFYGNSSVKVEVSWASLPSGWNSSWNYLGGSDYATATKA